MPVALSQLDPAANSGRYDLIFSGGASGGFGFNTAANGTWTITVINQDTFSLNGSAAIGAYTGGGTWTRLFANDTPLQNNWHHVTAMFFNGQASQIGRAS